MSSGQLCLFDFAKPLLDRFGESFFKKVPEVPGVYVFSGAGAQVLYVGQSHNLKLRLAFYRNARPEKAPRRIIRLVHQVESIRWECCEDPESAQAREIELIQAHRPKFNAAFAGSAGYVFFGLSSAGERLRLRLFLQGGELRQETVIGAFKNHGLCRRAFGSIGRLAWAISGGARTAYDFPISIAAKGRAPDICLDSSAEQALREKLEDFLQARSDRFLDELHRLIEREEEPFLKKLYEQDLLTLTEFYLLARRMKSVRDEATAGDLIDPEQIDKAILQSRVKADAEMRREFRARKLEPKEQRQVSRNIFAYYRWKGWLESSAPLRKQLKQACELRERYASAPESFTDEEILERSIPGWAREIAPLSADLLRELQQEPRLWLRARPGEGERLSKDLHDCRTEPRVPDALWYRGALDLFKTAEFHQGRFEIQDISSQMVGLMCAPQPGEAWWDACAGEGGKTLHLCDLMQNKGLVWASDPAEWRLKILKKRASRAGLFNYRTKIWPASGQLPTKTMFDGVLVDAPCSGLGTWGRNPHARWTTELKDVLELAEVQKQILRKTAPQVKPGGKLVYSVCTLARQETGEVRDWFTESHANFDLISTRLLMPQDLHGNGMFVTIWRRKD